MHLLGALALFPIACLSPAAQDAVSEEVMPRTRATMDDLVQEGQALGLAATITRAGQVVFEHACGRRSASSEDEPGLDTIFRIYSMSKPITAVAALTFFDQGRFGLDDPIARYLPELADLGVRGQKGGETIEARPISVRDVFMHTSGWSYSTPWEQEARRQGSRDPDLATLVKALGNLPLEFQPGSRWRYGISSDVLGRFVEVLGQKTLDEVFQERIFDPLGMADTAFSVPAEKRGRLAQLSIKVEGRLVPSPAGNGAPSGSAPTFLSGGGGLYSTLADYLRFLEMMRRGGAMGEQRILKESTVALMTRDHLGERPGEMLLAGRGFGLGVAVVRADRPWMGNAGSWSWGGAAGTSFWVDPQTDVVAVFMNQTWLDMGPRVRFQFAAAADIARWGAR